MSVQRHLSSPFPQLCYKQECSQSNTSKKAPNTSWWPLAFFSLGLVLHYTLGAWKWGAILLAFATTTARLLHNTGGHMGWSWCHGIPHNSHLHSYALSCSFHIVLWREISVSQWYKPPICRKCFSLCFLVMHLMLRFIIQLVLSVSESSLFSRKST